MALDPIFTTTPVAGVAKIINATGTALVSLLVAASDGTRIVGIQVANSHTSDHRVYFWLELAGGEDRPLFDFLVPANAGFNGTIPARSVLDSLPLGFIRQDVYKGRYFDLPAGATLQARVATAVPSGTSALANAFSPATDNGLYFHTFGEDY